MKTKERLAEVLREHGLQEMEAKALVGTYDDFESESPSPINDLVAEFLAHGREDLAQRATAGEWDGTIEEAEAWYERNWAKLSGGET